MTEHHHKDGDGTNIDDILPTFIDHENPPFCAISLLSGESTISIHVQHQLN